MDTNRRDAELLSFNRHDITKSLQSFKTKNHYVKDWAFGSHNLNAVMNYFALNFSPETDKIFHFDLQNEYNSMNLRISIGDRNHFQVCEVSLL